MPMMTPKPSTRAISVRTARHSVLVATPDAESAAYS